MNQKKRELILKKLALKSTFHPLALKIQANDKVLFLAL